MASNVLDGYLSRKELAEQLKKSVFTILRWERLQVGPPPTRVGQEAFYHVDSVRAWLRDNERPSVRARRRKHQAA